jgi:hypothetical protein
MWLAGANGMDSTELMRELNSSIDMLMDSENYLLALNESMNQVCFHTTNSEKNFL